MDIVFSCLQDGQSLYAVREHGSDLFVGTRDECGRFLALHNEKVLDERERDRRGLRHAPFEVRTYRAPRRIHA